MSLFSLQRKKKLFGCDAALAFLAFGFEHEDVSGLTLEFAAERLEG